MWCPIIDRWSKLQIKKMKLYS